MTAPTKMALVPVEATERMFPLLDAPKSIPWSVIDPWERQAYTNHSQSLSDLARRGGLSACEAYAVMNGKKWSEIDNMKQPDSGLRLMALVKERLPLVAPAASPSSGRLTAADLERAAEAAWNSRGVACKWQWLTAKQRDFYVRQQRAAFAAIGLPVEGEQG